MSNSDFGSDGQLHDPEPDEGPDVLGEPATAAQRLRAFEDRALGEDHPRYKNQVEKGHGSPFSLLPANARAHHAALENLIAVEKEHADAEAHMTTVHAKLEAAVARASETEEAL